MAKYRKKPVVIEAMQVPEPGYEHRHKGEKLMAWLREGGCRFVTPNGGGVVILTKEGDMRADYGDWIIREPFATDDRRFYPCKPDIFEATYERVDE